ncbi:MAG TPA: inositol monophosphatase [Candidatus Desulfofervidus auxilii]|uniref:Inositol-1-monophosphatase n=1 Tax=Desulfofervidus auxilii TaxID=1621989 RepID=A0A7C2A8L4_DESA2|nr:inositol monophosphatase [Candidatus Desulfofervidus auxilii]
MKEFYHFGIDISLKAGEEILNLLPRIHEIRYKGAINLVTEADLKSEAIIKKAIRKRYPNHTILAEESGLEERGDIRWVIDPLDGTTNFAHGLPWFCTSLALEVEGEIVLGIVYNPVLKECFSAIKEKGAFLNQKPIRVSQTKELGKALLATGFPYDIQQNPEPVMTRFRNMIMHARGVRRAGSAALDLCYVACGRFDGFWEERLHPWDTAAGMLIVQEAGGRVSDFSNNFYSIYGKEILATNGFLHRDMLKILQGRNL